MFNREEFQKNIKAILDNTPGQFKTTINGSMHWGISQSFIEYFQPKIEELEARIKELEDGYEERGLQESQGNEESSIKTSRRRKE